MLQVLVVLEPLLCFCCSSNFYDSLLLLQVVMITDSCPCDHPNPTNQVLSLFHCSELRIGQHPAGLASRSPAAGLMKIH